MRLSRRAFELLDLLRWYASRFRRVFPSQAKLAEKLKLTIRQVKRLVKQLRDCGVIKTFRCGRCSQEYEIDSHHALVENVPSKSLPLPVKVPSVQPAPYLLNSVKRKSRYARQPEVRRKPPQMEPNSLHPWVTQEMIDKALALQAARRAAHAG